jgi:hypothetical protein
MLVSFVTISSRRHAVAFYWWLWKGLSNYLPFLIPFTDIRSLREGCQNAVVSDESTTITLRTQYVAIGWERSLRTLFEPEFVHRVQLFVLLLYNCREDRYTFMLIMIQMSVDTQVRNRTINCIVRHNGKPHDIWL